MFFYFCGNQIDAIGYDAQRAQLEVRLYNDQHIRRYLNVPEEVWYSFRESASPEIYYRRCICGHFPEMRMAGGQPGLTGSSRIKFNGSRVDNVRKGGSDAFRKGEVKNSRKSNTHT